MYAQMLHYRIVSHYPTKVRGFEFSSARDDEDVEAFVTEYPELFMLEKSRYGWTLVVAPNYATPTLRILAHELMLDESQAQGRVDRKFSDYELLACVVAKGKTYSYYGSLINLELEHIHLFRCGIDWNRYHGVTDERWMQFTDTFNEPDYDTVLEAELVCRCGDTEIRFGLEPPSLSKMFVVLSVDALEELF